MLVGVVSEVEQTLRPHSRLRLYAFPNAQARMAVFDFIEGWYNPRRRHSALNYKSPLEYERAASLVAAAPTV